ncbi:LysR family transcriptional regulator [Desulfovibrio sp. OttesenSCG-928-A18]|nr:LysR family transcriptional regulator [Desulfovibrio sp. OttesenSCG-928-A18]
MRLSVKIFLEDNGEFVVGPGRLELLKAIDELGSLRKAAQKLGMSYRWAWGRLNRAEEELGRPLLVRTDEPVGGRPMVLTPEAHELIAWFGKVEKYLQKTMREADKGMPEFLIKKGQLSQKNPDKKPLREHLF